MKEPTPLELHLKRPVVPPTDWSLVSEVQIFAPVFTDEIKNMLNEARKHGKTLRGMNEEAINAMDNFVTEH